MDIVGGVMLAGGGEAKIVSRIDDHSRFVISAHVVARATAGPTCDALTKAMRAYGCPEQILTDDGKVFTGRFGPGTGEVLFDRICRENGIKHLLTAPRSPTTTGKVERWHMTLRSEFLTGKVFADITDAQAQLDVWVAKYNEERPHQGIGNEAPIERFRLRAEQSAANTMREVSAVDPAGLMPAAATRRVTRAGKVSFASTLYPVGVWLAGQDVAIVCDNSLVQIHHNGVLVVTHARRHDPSKQAKAQVQAPKGRRRARPSASVVPVTRKVNSHGKVCFAGQNYCAGTRYKRRQVQVAVVGDTVEIAVGEELIRRQSCVVRGHVRARSGAWEVRAYAGVDVRSGKRRYVTRTVHGSRASAERALRALNSIGLAVVTHFQVLAPQGVTAVRGRVDQSTAPRYGPSPSRQPARAGHPVHVPGPDNYKAWSIRRGPKCSGTSRAGVSGCAAAVRRPWSIAAGSYGRCARGP